MGIDLTSLVSDRDLVQQQEGRGIVLHDLRDKKTKLGVAKPTKPVAVAALKPAAAPKRRLVNSVFNLAQQN